MKTFQAFITERETAALGDIAPDNSSNNEPILRIARIAIDNHPQEIMNVFKKLAEINPEIRSELERYHRDKKGVGFANDEKFKRDYERDKDEIVPNSADSVGGDEI